ncbi:MAG: divergent PAP2 family protein, partial [Acidobacteriota bacterium]
MSFPLFLIPIVVGLIVQFSKRFFNTRYLSDVTVKGMKIPRYGGMPSAHTAFAFSLLTLVGMLEGFSSLLFAASTAATIFILDDALRMRIFLGRYGETLRRLIAKLPEEEQRQFPYLEDRLGHRPREVVAGAFVGIILT